MQDIEFTIRKVSCTCSSAATASGPARRPLNMAMDMLAEGLIDQPTA